MQPFLFWLFGSLLFVSNAIANEDKINGISFVASRHEITSKELKPLINTNANYAAIMPFGFIGNMKSPSITYNSKSEWVGETTEGAGRVITQLRDENVRTMLKPQLWLRGGQYTGHLTFTTETQWLEFEASYTDFILTYAKLAADKNVDIFCIGTELEQFVKQRSIFWNDLIQKVRTVYKGKLTYAANWDEYKRTPFWASVDYIGIDGYFPLSDEVTPSIDDIKQGWQHWKPLLSELSNKHKKPILFTEWGFRSIDHNAKEPWDHSHSSTDANLIAQSHAIQGTLESLWKEPWFAGGFVWKWFADYPKAGGPKDNRFTPQNKPAEDVLTEFFAQDISG